MSRAKKAPAHRETVPLPKAIKRFTLQFGLVCVPVNLHTAAKSNDLSFNQLHTACKGRIKQQQVCPTCDPTKALDKTEIVKGFEYTKGQYVTLQDEELASLALPSTSVIAIQHFVEAREVDSVNFDTTYWLSPDDQGGKPYALLQQVMQETGQAAMATITIRKKEQACLVRAHEGSLLVHTLYNATDLTIVPPVPVEISPEENAMAKQLVMAMRKNFTPIAHTDRYEASVRALIDRKLSGDESLVPEVTVPAAPVMDLAAMLKASMAQAAA